MKKKDLDKLQENLESIPGVSSVRVSAREPDAATIARRAELIAELAAALRREEWCGLEETNRFANALNDQVKVLERDAAREYWDAEKPPSAGDIQRNRGEREALAAITSEILKGQAGQLRKDVLAVAEEFEAAVTEKDGEMFSSPAPDYLAEAKAEIKKPKKLAQ